jgi:hypothetical protein
MKLVDAFLITAFFAFMCSMIYAIDTGIDNIRRSSYNIGCMSVVNATPEAIELCKSLVDYRTKSK